MRIEIKRISSLLVLAVAFGLLPMTPFSIVRASGAVPTITFEDVLQNRVVLGALASRSQNAGLSRSGSGAPYTMSALANDARGAYSYQTDAPYGQTANPVHSNCTVNTYGTRGCLTQLRESDERQNGSSGPVVFSGNTSGTDSGKSGIIDLTQVGNIQSTPTGGLSLNRMASGEYSFGAIFGPEIYSRPFVGSTGQAVTYQWKATGVGDDYEVYGFLVKISDNTGAACTGANGVGTYGLSNPTTTHTILSYGRGKASAWTTTTGSISTGGCYRFRFVGGTYDASGGLYVGGTFRVYDVQVSKAQTLTFTQPADMIRSSSDQTFTASAMSSESDAILVYDSDTKTICTVSGTTVTVKANQSGICTLKVDSAARGDYGAAPTTYTSFAIQVAATAPISTGGDAITGSAKVCSTLTADEGSWSNGGSSYTGTTYQWKRNGVAIIGATNSTYIVQANDVGAAISYDISKSNSIGTTTATSSSVIPVDARLSSISISSGTLSPSFDGCTYSYSANLSTSSITVTPTVSSNSASVTVAGSAVVSGQASGAITLNVGSNSISLVVSNGSQSTTTTLTITYAEAPTVTILAPTSVTGSSATLNATVNARGQSTSNIYFEISTSSTFASDTATVTATPSTATGTGNTSVSAASPTLVFQTTYYVRIFATNATGTTTSNTFNFTTPAAPFVTTVAASDTSTTGATLNGTVVGNGEVGGTNTTVVFQYSSNSDMSSPIEVSPTSNGTITAGDTSSTSVSKALTGLSTGNTYYFRVKASNNFGTNFGSILSFTLKGAPAVSTQSASNITTTTARLNGTVNANADATTSIVFNWGTSEGSLTNTLAVTPTSVSGNSNTTVVGNLSGLSPNTNYFYKLTATNSINSTQSTPVTSFTTLTDARPTATLSAPGNSLLSQPFTVTVTFSEAVTGFAASDITVSGTSNDKWVAQIAQQISTSLYTVEFRPNSPTASTLTIALAQNVVADTGGLSQGNTAAESITIVTSSGVLAPSISYPSYTVAATQNTSISTLIPSNSGGIIASWSISASLPSGLTFSTTSGQISGTPTVTLSSTNFVVTATNSAGSDTKTIAVSVSAQLVPIISYSPSIISAVVGTAITSLTPTNTGEAATSWSISPSLPSGLSLNTSSGVISGTSTVTSASATYTITATTSTSATGTTTITVSSTNASATVPNAPTIGIATATGATTATVTYTAPGSDGGATITTYTATSSPGSITGSVSQAGSGTISITGLTSGTTYTFTVVATNAVGNSSPSTASNAITTTSSTLTGIVPTFSSVTTAANGFTVTLTNYNATYTWAVSVTAPATVTISSTGLITVTGLSGQGTPATVTVTTSRTGYTTQSASITGTTNPPPPPPNYLYTLTAPTLSRVSTTYVCLPGTYEFVRAAVTKEIPNISFFIYTLIVNGIRVSQISTNGTTNSPYVGPSAMTYPATASKTQAIFELGARTDILPAQCEVLAYQENAVGMGNSNILAKATPNVTWPAIVPITDSTKLGSAQLNATADVEGTFVYSVTAGTTLGVGKYTLTVTFTPKDIDNYDVVVVKNQLRVLTASTSIRNPITIQAPQQTIAIRTSAGALKADPEMLLGGKATAGSAGFGIERISISGSSVTVWPMPGFSGKSSLALIQSGAGGIIEIVQPLIVVLTGVSLINVNVLDFAKPTLNWSAVQGATSYVVSANGVRVCSAAVNTCIGQIPLGPKSLVSVTATGKDLVKTTTQPKVVIKANVEAASVNFDSGEFVLSAAARAELLRFARAIRPLGYTKITLTGHTDTDQGVDNSKLSEDRAKSVLEVLQRLLPGVSISIKGQAASAPVASNNTEAGKAQNRRVEIRVVQLQP